MPLAIDLFCGLGGWAEGLLAEGYDVIGFDIERHEYGEHKYPATLVIQDVLTLHGSQFRAADLIVASPPCQEYSYMAMPWTLAKAKAAAIRADTTGKMLADLNRLFDASFRIQAEASLAACRHIPLIVENVRGAQPWVGRARWAFGSFYLWGNVPALMPFTHNRLKGGQTNWRDHDKPGYVGEQLQDHFNNRGVKVPGLDWNRYGQPDYRGEAFNTHADRNARKIKNNGGSWFNDSQPSISRMTSSKSSARKAASAMIAKIPEPLARHIARVYRDA